MIRAKILSFLFFSVVGLVFLPSRAGSAPSPAFGLQPNGRLDQDAIAKAYRESDWESVVSTLEPYLRKIGDSKVALDERIFAYKYLGVIYAADSLTRLKAESYFTRLLDLSPKVEIVDLFPSKKVNELFREVKSEHNERLSYTHQFDIYGHRTGATGQTLGAEKNGSGPSSADPGNANASSRQSQVRDKGAGWVWWTVGLTAVAGAGAGVYYWSTQNEPDKQVRTQTVGKPESTIP